MFTSVTIQATDNIYAFAFDSHQGEAMVNFTISEEGDSHRLHLSIPFDVVMGLVPKAMEAARDNEKHRAMIAQLQAEDAT